MKTIHEQIPVVLWFEYNGKYRAAGRGGAVTERKMEIKQVE
jgi:hypothetical protein